MGIVRANFTLFPEPANGYVHAFSLYNSPPRTGVLLSALVDWSGASFVPGTDNYTPGNVDLSINDGAGNHFISALAGTGGEINMKIGFESHMQWRHMNADAFYGFDALRYGSLALNSGAVTLCHGTFINGMTFTAASAPFPFNHKLAIQIEAYLYE